MRVGWDCVVVGEVSSSSREQVARAMLVDKLVNWVMPSSYFGGEPRHRATTGKGTVERQASAPRERGGESVSASETEGFVDDITAFMGSETRCWRVLQRRF